MYPGDNYSLKIWQCDKCLSSCHICVVWECCVMKIRWLTCVQAMTNWWIFHCWSNVHDRCQFIMMPMDVLHGDISMYPHDTKKWPISHHNSRLPPWRNIDRICIVFRLEEHIWIQCGECPSITVFFFGLAHHEQWLFGNVWDMLTFKMMIASRVIVYNC